MANDTKTCPCGKTVNSKSFARHQRTCEVVNGILQHPEIKSALKKVKKEFVDPAKDFKPCYACEVVEEYDTIQALANAPAFPRLHPEPVLFLGRRYEYGDVPLNQRLHDLHNWLGAKSYCERNKA